MNKREFNFNLYVPVYGDGHKVYIKSVFTVNHIEKLQMGALVGYVRIIYPFAGVQCHMDLELYKQEKEYDDIIVETDTCHKDYDLSFKIPFACKKTFFEELLQEEQLNIEEEEAVLEVQEYLDYLEDCECGGKMLPMYEEHPNWIKFCSQCDSRSENTDRSPLPY